MTTELWILVFMGFFTFALGVLPAVAKLQAFRFIQTGNYQRDNLPPLTGWGRSFFC